MKLMKEAATKAGFADRFQPLELAVTFDDALDLRAGFRTRAPRRRAVKPNAQGAEQGTCVHLGNCDIGCDVHAKNTLDLNYLSVAEKHGAPTSRPLHLVDRHRADRRRLPRLVTTRSTTAAVVPGRRDRRASSSSRPARSARPSCCCAAATSTRRCRS